MKTLKRDREWFRTIYSNRMGHGDGLSDYDVVIGPVANDTLFETYGIATSGQLTDDLALKIMSIGPSYEQVVVKSAVGLIKLKWLDAYTIGKDSMNLARENYALASKEFDAKFAELLNSIEL